MNNDRAWMYQRKDKGFLNLTFLDGLETFMQYAISQPSSLNGTNVQCPCSKCKNGIFWNAETVKVHLMSKGFVEDYYEWNRHGEPYVVRQSGEQSSTHYSNTQGRRDDDNLMYNMVMDVVGPSFDLEMPNAEAQKLYDILKSSERELYEGCETSQLSAMAQMLSLKSDHHWSETCYDQTSQFFKGILPQDNALFDSFYSTKKYMEELGLPSEQIDCCVNGCMIYWGEDINMESCKFCSHARYKERLNISKKVKKKVPFKRMIYFPLAPRLQRLYASPTTSAHMRWHAEHYQEEGVMRHCSDSEEWKQFDRAYPSFSSETRNVRLGHILFNCPEVSPYTEIFINQVRDHNPYTTNVEIDRCLESDFAMWFKHYAQNSSLVSNEYIRDISLGPLRSIKSVPIYYVNGYKFHTREYGADRSTFNSGVCIKGSNYSETFNDYFGIIEEILIVEYPRLPIKKTTLFKCEWFDPTFNVGTRIHPRYNIVEVNKRKRLSVYEPFILAMQAMQVYFCNYPSLRRDKIDWLVVCKVKARALVELPQPPTSHREPFQDDVPQHLNMINTDDIPRHLNDENGVEVDLDEDDGTPEEEIEYESDEDEDESSRTEDNNNSENDLHDFYD